MEPSEPAITIADRIKTARRRNNMTQQELADAIGVSKPTIYRWENAKVKMDAEALGKISDVLGVTEVWLRGAGIKGLQLAGESDMFDATHDPHMIARKFGMALQKKTPEHNGYKVADRRDIQRAHGSRADKVEFLEVRASSMARVIQRGEDVEYVVSEEYTGPGVYLIRLVEGEYPHPAYLVRRSPKRIKIIYDNSDTEFEIVRDEDGWRDADTGELVNFEIVGSAERWTESRADLKR